MTTSAGLKMHPSRSSSTATSSARSAGSAEEVIRELLADHGEVRYVWRHLPLNDVHPRAQLASEAAEARRRKARTRSGSTTTCCSSGRARSSRAISSATRASSDSTSTGSPKTYERTRGAAHIAEDVDGADLSGVSGTPTFFVNGRRHYGAYDIDALTMAVKAAKARATLAAATAQL